MTDWKKVREMWEQIGKAAEHANGDPEEFLRRVRLIRQAQERHPVEFEEAIKGIDLKPVRLFLQGRLNIKPKKKPPKGA